MKIKYIGPWAVALLLSASLCPGARAQQPVHEMTLEQCIGRAQEKNLTIRSKELDVRRQELGVQSAKHQFLPTVSASAGQGWNFGRSQDKRGVYIDQSSANTSIGLNGNLELFSGLGRLHSLNAAKLDLEAQLQNLEQARYDVALEISRLYINALFQKELTRVAQLQIDQTRTQLDYATRLVAAGRWARGKQMELEAQLAKEEASHVEAANQEQLALVALMQALEINPADTMLQITAPDIDRLVPENRATLQPIEDTYQTALGLRPSIRAARLGIQSAEKQVQAARSAYFPSLSLGAGYSNSYYRTFGNKMMEAANIPFEDQLKQNGRSYIGLSLNIPIFNRLETTNSVRRSQLQVEQYRLQLENEQKSLYKEITQAYYDALAANRRIAATHKATESSRLAYEYAEERMKADKISVNEFSQAKTNLMLSQAEELRAKYDFVFKSKVLDFYRGIHF